VETIFVLLPLALLIAAIAVGFFVWAARSGQFDDLETPAVRILFDDVPATARPAAEDVGLRRGKLDSGVGNQEPGAGSGDSADH
jgi:cbb3-type cytochrome oxidase maturation protein